MKISVKILLLLLSAILYIGCNGGIDPNPVSPPLPKGTGLAGKVSFKGTWDPNVKRTHLVAFKNPIQSQADFFPPNLAFISDTIPWGSNAYTYNSVENSYVSELIVSPGEYKYVAVAQQYTEELSLFREDWIVVGVYYTANDTTKPGSIVIQNGIMTSGVDVVVDFSELPPQPPN